MPINSVLHELILVLIMKGQVILSECDAESLKTCRILLSLNILRWKSCEPDVIVKIGSVEYGVLVWYSNLQASVFEEWFNTAI